MLIRDARQGDAAALAEIYFRGVRIGAAPAYSEPQLAAWAPQCPPTQAWADRLSGLLTLVADDGAPQGFMSLRLSDGYLDFAYVQPEQRGKGTAAQLYAVLENRARAAGLPRLHTQASHMAKPFFAKAGWTTLKSNAVTRGDQTIDNWLMYKHLT